MCNVCQGGALFTLADLAIAALMNYQGQLTFLLNKDAVLQRGVCKAGWEVERIE